MSSRWDQRTSPYLAGPGAVGSGRLPPTTTVYDASKYHQSGAAAAAQPSYSVNPANGTTTLHPAQQFTYTTGNPYDGKYTPVTPGQSSYIGGGPVSAQRFPRPEGAGRGWGRGRGLGGRGRGGPRHAGPRLPKPVVIKPKPPPPLTSVEKSKIENHNMKQLVAPKPPHRILNEMVGGGVRFEYTENPPIPPGMMTADMPPMHTLLTEVEGDRSTGTGPNHEIAKNICAEHAIMGVVSRRYARIASSAGQDRGDMLLQDETPFELASVAVFKMLNEWEAAGYELPRAISDVLYSQQMLVPVKQRLDWIRGSNMGFSTPIVGGVSAQGGRKRPMHMPSAGSIEQKNPVSFLNEIRGTVDYILLGTYGSGPGTVFTMGINIDGVPYSGNGPNKKDAKKNCAKDVLARLYSIKT